MIPIQTSEQFRGEIEKVLDVLRQGIAMHQGGVELVEADLETGRVSVRFHGMCVGCPLSSLTLKAGIEETLRELIPQVSEVVAVE